MILEYFQLHQYINNKLLKNCTYKNHNMVSLIFLAFGQNFLVLLASHHEQFVDYKSPLLNSLSTFSVGYEIKTLVINRSDWNKFIETLLPHKKNGTFYIINKEVGKIKFSSSHIFATSLGLMWTLNREAPIVMSHCFYTLLHHMRILKLSSLTYFD